MKAGAKSSTRAAVGSPGSRRGGSATPPSPTAPDVADATAAGHGTPPSPRSPAAGDEGGSASAPAPAPRVPRVAIFEAPLSEIRRTIKFNKLEHNIDALVTKYGDFLMAAGSWGACISGTVGDEPLPKIAGSKLFNGIAARHDSLKHNNMQLIDHIEVNSDCFNAGTQSWKWSEVVESGRKWTKVSFISNLFYRTDFYFVFCSV